MKKEKIYKGVLTSPTHHILKAHIVWQLKTRDSMQNGDGDLRLLRCGINYSICLQSAIFLDGCLCEGLSRLASLMSVYPPEDDFTKRLTKKIKIDISRSTNFSAYSELSELLIGRKLIEVLGDDNKAVWESAKILKSLRDVLAHGRSLKYEVGWSEDSGNLSVDFGGTYKTVEDFLIKNKLLVRAYSKQPNLYDFLTDKIADWAWHTAQDFLTKIEAGLNDNERSVFQQGIGKVAEG